MQAGRFKIEVAEQGFAVPRQQYSQVSCQHAAAYAALVAVEGDGEGHQAASPCGLRKINTCLPLGQGA